MGKPFPFSPGVFPQDDYPAEVSTDEDDDEMFGSRRKMRKRRRNREVETKEEAREEGESTVKKRKGNFAHLNSDGGPCNNFHDGSDCWLISPCKL